MTGVQTCALPICYSLPTDAAVADDTRTTLTARMQSNTLTVRINGTEEVNETIGGSGVARSATLDPSIGSSASGGSDFFGAIFALALIPNAAVNNADLVILETAVGAA